jgi:hypothetical protein
MAAPRQPSLIPALNPTSCGVTIQIVLTIFANRNSVWINHLITSGSKRKVADQNSGPVPYMSAIMGCMGTWGRIQQWMKTGEEHRESHTNENSFNRSSLPSL